MASNTTTSLAKSAAVDRVFAIPELLTHILSYLDPKTLLHCTRISTTFQSTIAAAPALQHALFLKPNWEHPLHQRVQNTLLNNLSRDYLAVHVSLVLPGGVPHSTRVKRYHPGDDILVQLWALPKAGSNASMYICQPPVTALELYAHCHLFCRGRTMQSSSQLVARVEDENGVTYGDVCRAIVAAG